MFSRSRPQMDVCLCRESVFQLLSRLCLCCILGLRGGRGGGCLPVIRLLRDRAYQTVSYAQHARLQKTRQQQFSPLSPATDHYFKHLLRSLRICSWKSDVPNCYQKSKLPATLEDLKVTALPHRKHASWMEPFFYQLVRSTVIHVWLPCAGELFLQVSAENAL